MGRQCKCINFYETYLLLILCRLEQVIDAVRQGQTKRAPIERIVDVVTSYFVPVVTALAIVTWIVWLSLGLSGSLSSDNLSDTVGGWRKSCVYYLLNSGLILRSSNLVFGVCHCCVCHRMPMRYWSRCAHCSLSGIWSCSKARYLGSRGW